MVEDGTDKVSRNVDKQPPTYSVKPQESEHLETGSFPRIGHNVKQE